VTSERVYNGQLVVYRADTKNRVLEPVISIGSRPFSLAGTGADPLIAAMSRLSKPAAYTTRTTLWLDLMIMRPSPGKRSQRMSMAMSHYGIIIVLSLSMSCWQSIAESPSTLNCKWCLLMVKTVTHTTTTTMPMPRSDV
jgi:hypothetical protein